MKLDNKIFGWWGLSRGNQLGPLEKQLLQVLWARESATVRELLGEHDIRLAYTTVMTTLDRLYKKGFLNRIAEGRAFRYSPRQTLEEFKRSAALEGIQQLLGSEAASSLPLSYLVEALSERDAQLLDELQQLIERKRRTLRGKH